MLGFKGSAQPSTTLGDALNAGYGYLEVRCLGCDTHSTVALDVSRRRRRSTSLNGTCAARNCSQVRGYPYKRSHLVALRRTRIAASDPPTHGGRERGKSLRMKSRLIKVGAELFA
jgi:hypothetical protein